MKLNNIINDCINFFYKKIRLDSIIKIILFNEILNLRK